LAAVAPFPCCRFFPFFPSPLLLSAEAFTFDDFFCFPPAPPLVAVVVARREEGEGRRKEGPKISEAYITGGGSDVNLAMEEKDGMEGI
jgi:hypothetical protein